MPLFANPQRRLSGRGRINDAAPALPRPRGNAEDASSPLTTIAPLFEPIKAAFDVIQIPSGTAIVTSGNSMIYPLRVLQVPDETFGQEILYLSSHATLLPSDSTGAGSSGVTGGGGVDQAKSWGDTAGLSAAIIIAKSLGLKERQFNEVNFLLPGIEENPTASKIRDPLPKILATFYFPTGKINDTTPNKVSESRFHGGSHVNRISEGETLDICLVFRGSDIASAGGVRYICGFADITVNVGLVKNNSSFYQ
jgi:hypothetical protein